MSRWASDENPKLVVKWNDKEARYYWVLLKDYVHTSESFRASTRPEVVASGDEEWAKRISKHYGIEMPVAKEAL